MQPADRLAALTPSRFKYAHLDLVDSEYVTSTDSVF